MQAGYIHSGSVEVSQKIKNRTTSQPSNSTSGYVSEFQNTNLKGYVHPYVHCSIIYNRPAMQANLSVHQ